jgi:GNAT superfamily N-acetyltransferase
MSHVIRPAVPADAGSIATVHIRSWQAAYRGQLPDRYLDELEHELPRRTEFWHAHISTPPQNTEIWVAQDPIEIVGFLALGPARAMDAKMIGEIYAIYVHPRSWNQGNGQALFQHGEGRLRSMVYSQAILWVLESNARARQFYEIAGWVVDGASKTETLTDGIELREICYRKTLQRKEEE